MIEFFDHGAVAAVLREVADMALDDDGFLPGPPAPGGGAPWIRRVVDHLARTEHIFRLEIGSRIGDVDLVVDAEFVAGACFRARYLHGKPAVVAERQRMGSF